MSEILESEEYINKLLEYGFKEYPVNKAIEENDRSFSYKVIENEEFLFSVHVRFWRHSRYISREIDGFDALVYFTDRYGIDFKVQLHSIKKMEPKDIVRWFNKIFEVMDCKYYRNKSDD